MSRSRAAKDPDWPIKLLIFYKENMKKSLFSLSHSSHLSKLCRPIKRYASFITPLLALWLAACSMVPQEGALSGLSGATSASKEGLAMAKQALQLVGIPYHYGGDSPKTGFDCSGLVHYAAQQALGIKLPRTSKELSMLGRAVSQRELSAGDLVFFNTLGRPYSHVGIYINRGNFVNAPSSGESVRIDNLEQPYWKAHYEGARRLTANLSDHTTRQHGATNFDSPDSEALTDLNNRKDPIASFASE